MLRVWGCNEGCTKICHQFHIPPRKTWNPHTKTLHLRELNSLFSIHYIMSYYVQNKTTKHHSKVTVPVSSTQTNAVVVSSVVAQMVKLYISSQYLPYRNCKFEGNEIDRELRSAKRTPFLAQFKNYTKVTFSRHEGFPWTGRIAYITVRSIIHYIGPETLHLWAPSIPSQAIR